MVQFDVPIKWMNTSIFSSFPMQNDYQSGHFVPPLLHRTLEAESVK